MRDAVRLLAGIALAAAAAAAQWQFGPKDGQDLPPTDLKRVVANTPAPDFVLPTGDGRTLSLSQFRGRNVVLVFYRGHW